MLRRLILAIVLIVTATPTSAAVNRRLVKDMQTGISLSYQAERGDVAIKAMIAVACIELIRVGRPELCKEIQGGYNDRFDGYLSRMVSAKGLGDHKPLSMWLAVVTETLQLILGEQVMVFTHLDDLRIMNFAIPVVFSPEAYNQWCLETTEVSCQVDYSLHFVPFAGTCSYWGAWAACTAATWGGGIAFLCTPVGMATEHVVRKWVAPRLSDRIYLRANEG